MSLKALNYALPNKFAFYDYLLTCKKFYKEENQQNQIILELK